MASRVTLQPTTLATLSSDKVGCLLFIDGDLTAVIVRLDDEVHGDDCGSWFLEVGLGRCDLIRPPVFPSIEAAQTWVLTRYSN